jgi:hypothetical protein
MSLCLIESSAGVFIPQSFMSIYDLKLCSAIRLHYCFGLLFSPCCAFGRLPESTRSGGSQRNGISSWTISPARPGSKPATEADELGMLLQTEFHYPKRSKKKKKKKKNKKITTDQADRMVVMRTVCRRDSDGN